MAEKSGISWTEATWNPWWVDGMNRQVPEQTISDECKWCGEDQPEWSPEAKCWIHRRPTLDRRCARKILGPCGELPREAGPETGRIVCTVGHVADVVLAYRPKSKQPKPRKRKKAKRG